MDSQNSQERMSSSTSTVTPIKVYKRRIWMLFLFSFLSLLCGMLFPLYSSVANVTACYYDVSENAVNWTCLLHMVVYIVFVFPVTWLTNVLGLRKTIIIASFINTLACVIQVASLNPRGFVYVMVSTFFASVSNTVVLGLPPFVAATWFPKSELSRACAFGVSGNMLGIAAGFVLSPLVMSDDCSNKSLITNGKGIIAYSLTGVNLFALLLLFISFQNAPEYPPSNAAAQRRESTRETYTRVILNVMRDYNFVLVFVVYGVIIGLYYAYTTTLNDLLVRFFPKQELDIGWIGLMLTVAGLFGSVVAGYILDYTGKFKETFLGICILSLVTCIISSCLLHVKEIWIQFVTISLFGFFLASMFPVGLEYGIEVTYPESEIIVTGLLNVSTMVFGIILTEIISVILDIHGDKSSNSIYCVVFFICCIICGFITKNYKRSKKNTENSSDSKDLG